MSVIIISILTFLAVNSSNQHETKHIEKAVVKRHTQIIKDFQKADDNLNTENKHLVSIKEDKLSKKSPDSVKHYKSYIIGGNSQDKSYNDALKRNKNYQEYKEDKDMFTNLDENLVLKRPFKLVPIPRKKEKVSIAERKSSEFMLNPAAIKTNKTGDAIAGVVELKLTYEELKKIGIIITDSQVEWIAEQWDRIHPIPFRNDDNYKYNTHIYPMVKANYPTNGEYFLTKERNFINLNYKYDPARDTFNLFGKGGYSASPKLVTDTIDGKIINTFKFIITSADDKKLIGLTMEKYNEIIEKSNLGFTHEYIIYNGWNKNSFSMTAPIFVAFSYAPYTHNYLMPYNQSPLLDGRKDKFNLDYSEFLPIEIDFKDKVINKIVFWFVPTDELIAKLPEKYRSPLLKEMSIIKRIKQGMLPAEEACLEIKDNSFFDVCRINSGAITIKSVDPNPVKNSNCNLNFTLKESREISVSLHDFSGNFIGSLINKKSLKSGDYSLPLEIKDVAAGIYLLAIKTNRGELVTQRIIVNN